MARRRKVKCDRLAKHAWLVSDVVATIISLFICKEEIQYSKLAFPGALASDLRANQHATEVINSHYSVDCVHHVGCLERPVRILLDVSKQPGVYKVQYSREKAFLSIIIKFQTQI